MKELFTYFFFALLPIPFLVFIAKSDHNWIFVIGLLIYALVYRPIVDGIRLVNKGVIEKEEAWKLIIPGSQMKYFRELYLK